MDKFSYINIREYLRKSNMNEIGEADLQEAISDFSCPINMDIEDFLKKNAIEFTKKNQSVTYLVFSNMEGDLVGYFTIAIKPLTINAEIISNTAKRKIERISRLDKATDTYTVSAFLIAQLGKNFTERANEKITGNELLDAAWSVVKNLQHAAGGTVAFLEAERQEKLLTFYKNNGFREFDIRVASSGNDHIHELVQLLRFV